MIALFDQQARGSGQGELRAHAGSVSHAAGDTTHHRGRHQIAGGVIECLYR